MKKVFISGPMSGYPGFNRVAFNDVAKTLSAEYIVLNPAVLPDGLTHDEYMLICYAMIDVCDAMYYLDGWGESKGAVKEYVYASGRKEILYLGR